MGNLWHFNPLINESVVRGCASWQFANVIGGATLLSKQFCPILLKKGRRLKILYEHPNDIIFVQMKYFLNKNRQFGDVAGARSPNWRSGDFEKKNFFVLKLPNSSRN